MINILDFTVLGSEGQPAAARSSPGGIVETEQMSSVETGQMSSVETRQMSQQQSSVLSQQQTSVLSQPVLARTGKLIDVC